MIGLFGAIGSLGNAVATLALGNLKTMLGFIIGQVWVLVFSITFLVADLPFWFGFGYFFIGGYRLCLLRSLPSPAPWYTPARPGWPTV